MIAVDLGPDGFRLGADLMDMAPADGPDGDDRAIDIRVARLRRTLDTEAIATIRGRDYRYGPVP